MTDPSITRFRDIRRDPPHLVFGEQLGDPNADLTRGRVVSQSDCGSALLDDFDYRLVLVHYHQTK